MLIRLLLLAAAIWFGWKLWKGWKQSQQMLREAEQRDPERFEPTVRCTRCGVHLPASAVSATGRCGNCA